MVRRRKRKLGILALLGLLALAIAAYVMLREPRRRPPPLPLPGDCELGPTVAGIDVSYYQGAITWPRVYRAGVRFAFIRAYDGTDVFDPQFVANWTGAKQANIARGAYQFFRPELSAIDQADLLIRALRTHGMGELPPVLDIETTGGLALADVAARAKAWIDRVRTELKVEPIVYTNPGMWRLGGAAPLATQPLWIAHYTSQCPEVPAPWSRWRLWQYTDAGRVPGIGHPVDLNVLAGSDTTSPLACCTAAQMWRSGI